ncbi:MAG: uroporphyrinogen-III C-methyltransferase [Bryobacteraceae bacterium]
MSKVYLVGAGPGDTGLITWKGRRVLEIAGAVLYDHLANEALLDLAPPSAERIYVGKKRTERAFEQDEIIRMMIERSRRGLTVVRLKGGDPFIFGRGGEELEALAAAGIEFEVVPGVTSPLGIAAYSGVPLTHRELARTVTFVTGHDPDAIDWASAGAADTLVILMGLTTFNLIAPKLVEAGRAADTPAIAVRWATRPEQQTVRGTLGDLPAKIAESGMKPPATIVIGEVVRMSATLAWYERLPLFGRRVVITRAAGQAGSLAETLRALGADPVEFPAIEIREAVDYRPLDAAIARLAEYDWLIFTSVNGVKFFLERLDASGADLRALRARICVIGPATRDAVERLHLKVDVAPAEYVAEGLVAALEPFDLAGKRVLLPRAASARDVIPRELARRGACVDVVEAYRTAMPEFLAARAREAFAARPHWITFTSGSTVRNVIAAAGASALAGVRVASIGPVTSAALARHGIRIDAEAASYTTEGLVAAIMKYEEANTRA